MCDCCCDCTELEDTYEEIIEALVEAQGSVWYYRELLEEQKSCSEDLKEIIQDFIDSLEEIGVDPTIDYYYLASVIGFFKGAAILIAIELSIAIFATRLLIEISETLEEIWQLKLDEWQDKLDKIDERYKKIKKQLFLCRLSLTECEACDEEFVDKEECGRECDGCGRWYCTNCFVVAIESAELAAGEAF